MREKNNPWFCATDTTKLVSLSHFFDTRSGIQDILFGATILIGRVFSKDDEGDAKATSEQEWDCIDHRLDIFQRLSCLFKRASGYLAKQVSADGVHIVIVLLHKN